MVVPRPRLALATLALVALPAAALADDRFDALGPREVALGESGRGAAQGAQSIGVNPSGLALDRNLVFDGTYAHRNLDGLNAFGVSGCDSTTPVAGCVYYRYLGASLDLGGSSADWRSHVVGVTAARALTPIVLIGAAVKWFDHNTELAGQEDVRGFATDLGLTIRPTSVVSVGVAGYNLIAKDTPRYPRGVGGGIALRPMGSLGLSFDAVFDLDRDQDRGKGRFGGGAEYFVSSGEGQLGYPVRLGGVYDALGEAGYVTGGLGLATVRVGLDVSARFQVSGPGDEFTLVAALKMFGPAGE
jgi:hypothetical protein